MQVLFGLAIIGLWELLTVTNAVNPIAMPEPWHVATFIGDWFRTGTIWSLVGATAQVAAIGLVIGLAAGTLLGFLTGTVRWFYYFFSPVLSFMNAIPQLVLLPILVVWLGFGNRSQVAIVIIVNVFLVAIVVQAAIKEIQGDFVNNVRVLGASWLQRVTSVYIPGTTVWIVSVTRLCVGHAIVAACVAEFFGSPRGLGYAIYYGLETFNTREVYSALIAASVLAYIVDLLLKRVDTRVSRYLPSRG
jgi:NitT/TauT family transport system permease protein